MNGWEMTLLGKRLEAAGYLTRRFSYPSVHRNLAENTNLLHQFLTEIHDREVHFVAHSLGGLLVRNLLNTYPSDVQGRVVTLGTPHQGSLVARAMSRSWIGSMLLGKALPSLSTKIPAGQEFFESDSSEFNSLEFGCIAGNRPLGMGMLLASVTKPHDGAVQLTETKFDQMTDYRVVPSNHMGLLFSRQVAEEVIQFLKAGCFLPETAQ
tara:strand:- start:147 stop:773 length:627 start_codon:yes stop_codon:yes gene_type:complete